MKYSQFQAQLQAQRWAILPDHYRAIIASLNPDGTLEGAKAALSGRVASRQTSALGLISIQGPIISSGFMAEIFGLPTHAGIAEALRDAADDAQIERIVIDMDCPGGVVAGIDSSVEAMRYAISKKPVTVAVSGLCTSAAYWIAAQAERIIAAPTAIVGNIGVIYTHFDVSEANKAHGINVQVFTTGKYKALLDENKPLNDDEQERFMAELNELYNVFTADVATGRNLTHNDVLKRYGDGAFYTGSRALDVGLIDEIGTLQGVLTNNIPPATRGGRKANMDLEQLKAEHPELYAQIMEEGKVQGKAEAQAQAPKETKGGDTALQDEVVRLRSTVEALTQSNREEKRRNIASAALEAAALPKQGKVGDVDLDAEFRVDVESVALSAETDEEAKTRVDAKIAHRNSSPRMWG